jgi:hypothetical protein
MDPHHLGNLDLHHGEKSDPDPHFILFLNQNSHQDPHQGDKSDPHPGPPTTPTGRNSADIVFIFADLLNRTTRS